MKKIMGIVFLVLLFGLSGCSSSASQNSSNVSSAINSSLNTQTVEWVQESICTMYPNAVVSYESVENYTFEFDVDSNTAFSVVGPISITENGSTINDTFLAAGIKSSDGGYQLMVVEIGGEIIYTAPQLKQQSGLTILEVDTEEDEYSTYIVGEVQNDSNTNYIYLSISYSIYDDSGNKIGTAWDNINGLSPGETWSFKAYVWERDEMDDYKLDSLSGY